MNTSEEPQAGPQYTARKVYGLGFDTSPPQIWTRSLSFCWFSRYLLVSFAFRPASFPTLLGRSATLAFVKPLVGPCEAEYQRQFNMQMKTAADEYTAAIQGSCNTMARSPQKLQKQTRARATCHTISQLALLTSRLHHVSGVPKTRTNSSRLSGRIRY